MYNFWRLGSQDRVTRTPPPPPPPKKNAPKFLFQSIYSTTVLGGEVEKLCIVPGNRFDFSPHFLVLWECRHRKWKIPLSHVTKIFAFLGGGVRGWKRLRGESLLTYSLRNFRIFIMRLSTNNPSPIPSPHTHKNHRFKSSSLHRTVCFTAHSKSGSRDIG